MSTGLKRKRPSGNEDNGDRPTADSSSGSDVLNVPCGVGTSNKPCDVDADASLIDVEVNEIDVSAGSLEAVLRRADVIEPNQGDLQMVHTGVFQPPCQVDVTLSQPISHLTSIDTSCLSAMNVEPTFSTSETINIPVGLHGNILPGIASKDFGSLSADNAERGTQSVVESSVNVPTLSTTVTSHIIEDGSYVTPMSIRCVTSVATGSSGSLPRAIGSVVTPATMGTLGVVPSIFIPSGLGNISTNEFESGNFPILNEAGRVLFDSVGLQMFSTGLEFYSDNLAIEIENKDIPLALPTTEYSSAPIPDLSSDEEEMGEASVKNVDSKIYEGAPITLRESFAAILSFIQSEHLSTQGVGRLLGLISVHLPQPNNFFTSSHMFFKLLSSQQEPVKTFFFCSKCYRSRGGPKDLCSVCEDVTRTVEHFLSLPLLPQLKKIAERPGFLADVNFKNTRCKLNPNNYEDIFDGKVYKEAEKCFEGPGKHLTLMWSTDGLQTYNSNTYSLWPFYFVIQELPPEKRFRSENLILGGIWGSETKPHPNIFLQPIYEDVKDLERGIDIQFHGEECVSKLHCKALSGTGDTPAISTFLQLKAHSGYYSCFKCEIVGENSVASGNVTVFPFADDLVLRSMDKYRDQVQWAHTNKVVMYKDRTKNPNCCGVIGPTILSSLVPDIFLTTAIDSMHCLCLGVMRSLLFLWFDKEFKNEAFSAFDKVKLVNTRLVRLKLPHFLDRILQLIDKLVHWKASELRLFLFYIALCVLIGVLDEKYLNHFMLLVQGVALLNTNSVSPEDIHLSETLLSKFVCDYQTLYGLRHMSSNVHKCLHLPSVVEQLGPLWCVSCWPFEDMNGRLARLIHGSRYPDLQVYARLSMITDLPALIFSMPEGSAKEYCMKLRRKFMRLKTNNRIADQVYSVGKDSNLSDTRISDELVRKGVVTEGNLISVRVFHRLLKDGLLYVGNTYGKGERESSFVQYSSNNYGNVECFVKVKTCKCLVDCTCSREYFAVIKPVEARIAFQSDLVSVRHIFSCVVTEGWDIVEVFDLNTVMYTSAFPGDERFFLSRPLNTFEME